MLIAQVYNHGFDFIPKEILQRIYDPGSTLKKVLIQDLKRYFYKSKILNPQSKIKMIYRALGVLFSNSGYSLAFSEFHENAGVWTFTLKENNSYPTGNSVSLIEKFIEENNLQYQVAMITLHADSSDVLFSGAAVAAATGLPVITDLIALDVALAGNGEFYNSALKKLNITNESLNELNKAICVSFMGVLRWREEYNFLSSVTGAKRSSIGGAVWLGQEG